MPTNVNSTLPICQQSFNRGNSVHKTEVCHSLHGNFYFCQVHFVAFIEIVGHKVNFML